VFVEEIDHLELSIRSEGDDRGLLMIGEKEQTLNKMRNVSGINASVCDFGA
jgi:hypothetical protein